MTEFGPPIPHVPGKPCPFPDAMGKVKFTWGWQSCPPARIGSWDWGGSESGGIIAYRLPADHHAYGPRVSRMGREPDRFTNCYDSEPFHSGLILESRQDVERLADPKERIGIWRIYLK